MTLLILTSFARTIYFTQFQADLTLANYHPKIRTTIIEEISKLDPQRQSKYQSFKSKV